MTTNNIPINVQEAEVIQAQLRKAGITMKIKLVDSTTLLADGNSKHFAMISYQWSGRPDPDGHTYQFYRTTQGTSLNWSGISNPQIDALLDRTREVSRPARARARPAPPRPVRRLDGTAPERRPRALDPQRRARHRERESPPPAESRAGFVGDAVRDALDPRMRG